MKLRGKIIFRARGTKLYKFINAVREQKIYCHNQTVKNEEYYGQIKADDIERLRELAEEYKIELFIEKREGIRFLAVRYKKRYGFIAGGILLVCMLVFFSNTVSTIEIEGNHRLSQMQVLAALDEAGIKNGTFIPEIDFAMCEQQITEKLKDISWVSIRHTGGRIVVELNETVEHEELNPTHKQPCNIVATETAQITGVRVYRGALVKLIGEGVSKGDVIVSGVVTDKKGKMMTFSADAEITGIYRKQIIFSQPFSEIQIERGQQHTEKYVMFFGARIPLFSGEQYSEPCERKESVSAISLFEKNLPLGVLYSRITPISRTEVIYTQEEALKEVEKKVFLYEKNFLSDKKILERTIQKNITQEKADYIVTYKLEGEIGRVQEFFLKNQ